MKFDFKMAIFALAIADIGISFCTAFAFAVAGVTVGIILSIIAMLVGVFVFGGLINEVE